MATTKKRARSKKPRPLAIRYLPILPPLNLDAVASATLNGAKFNAKLANAVTGGEIELSMIQATQLTLPFEDPDLEIWLSGLLDGLVEIDLGEAGRWRYSREGDIGGIGLAGTATTLTLWAIGEAMLRAQSGPLRKSSAKLDLAAITGLLAREQGVRDVVSLRTVVPNPGEVPPADTTTETTSKRSGGVTGGFTAADARRLYGQDHTGAKFKLSAAQIANLDTAMRRARAKKASPRPTKALILALFIESKAKNDKSVYHVDHDSQGSLQIRDSTARGMGVNNASVADSCDAFLTRGFWGKGGAIALAAKNPTMTAGWIAQQTQGSAHPERYDHASQAADLVMELWDGGSASGSTETTTREVKRPAEWRRGTAKKPESSWTMLDRYARQLGRRRFVALPLSKTPRLVVASDQQLIRAAPHLTIDGLADEIFTQRPNITLEGNAHLQTMEFRALTAGWTAPPGAVVHVEDAGDQTPREWLVQSVRVPLGNSPDLGVVLQQPTTKVEPVAATSTAASRSSTRTRARTGPVKGGDVASRIYDACVEISQAGGPYVYGGGHGAPLKGMKLGRGLDCSSSSSLALFLAGAFTGSVAIVSGAFAASYGVPGRGKHITIWAHNGHVFIELNIPGHRFRRFDTSPQRGETARGPRVRTQMRSTAGFVPRHPEGA